GQGIHGVLVKKRGLPAKPAAQGVQILAAATWETSMDKSYKGSCFCGSVQFTVSGEPAAMGYCHCESCRTWSAGPVNAFTLWKPESLKITKGSDQIGSYAKTPKSRRKWCKACGGHLFTDHPQWNLVDVYAAVIPGFEYKPGVHVNYQ